MNRFIFLDLETTGLDPDINCILEVGISVYDADNLTATIAERNWLVLPQWGWWLAHDSTDWWGTFNKCDSVVTNMHLRNGLAQEIADGIDRDTISPTWDVELEARQFVSQHSQGERLPMCGKSLHSLDRPFLRKFMPTLDGAFSHRNIDVSQLIMLHKMGWMGDFELEPLRLGTAHRALGDNHEAALLLDGYRKRLGMLRAMEEHGEDKT